MDIKDVLQPGYRKADHGGFSWLADELGTEFILGVDDWSLEVLAHREGWHSEQRRYHVLFHVRDRRGPRYLVKVYPPKGTSSGLLSKKRNRAVAEFVHAFQAHRKGIATVLPVAVGQRDRSWGIVVYPFLEKAISLDRVYAGGDSKALSILEKHSVERTVGRLLRDIVDNGFHPIDLVPNHFLFEQEKGRLTVYWVDLERVKSVRLFKKRSGVLSLGRLIAFLEWCRVSGGRITRAGMMRIACGFFRCDRPGKLDRRFCHAVIGAARKLWRSKGWDGKVYPAIRAALEK